MDDTIVTIERQREFLSFYIYSVLKKNYNEICYGKKKYYNEICYSKKKYNPTENNNYTETTNARKEKITL